MEKCKCEICGKVKACHKNISIIMQIDSSGYKHIIGDFEYGCDNCLENYFNKIKEFIKPSTVSDVQKEKER